MKMTNDGFIIKTKRKYSVEKLFELMQSNLQEKFGTMRIEEDRLEFTNEIVVKGADGFINLVNPSGKYIWIKQVVDNEAEVKERLSVTGTAANIAGTVFNKVTDAMGPEIGAVKGVVGGVVNTVGTVGRLAKFASEMNKRDITKGNWAVMNELATEIEKLVEVKKGGCYIATCIYGSYNCPEVWTLRRYRDTTLSSSWLGRQAIQIYYAISPTIVDVFGGKKWFNRLCKPLLNNFIQKLQKKGLDSSFYSDYTPNDN